VAKSPISPKHAERLLRKLFRFFSSGTPRLDYACSDPPWLKVFVSVDTSVFATDNALHLAYYLVQNSWRETFFSALDLRHVENDFLRCYETAKGAWRYLQKGLPGGSEYAIYDSRASGDNRSAKTIEEFIESFRESDTEDRKTKEAESMEKTATERNRRTRPLLDLL